MYETLTARRTGQPLGEVSCAANQAAILPRCAMWLYVWNRQHLRPKRESEEVAKHTLRCPAAIFSSCSFVSAARRLLRTGGASFGSAGTKRLEGGVSGGTGVGACGRGSC